MKKETILASLCCLLLFSCDRGEKKPTVYKDQFYLSDSLGSRNETRLGDKYSSPTDQGLIQKIRQALRNDFSLSTAEQRITITADNGYITIDGIVESEQQKNSIGNRARQVNGVQRVDNHVVISRELSDADEAADVDDEDSDLDDIEEDEDNDDNDYTQPGDQYSSNEDRQLISSIRLSLYDDKPLRMSSQHIQIAANKSTITLKGSVRTESDKATIEKEVKKVRGVKSVVNQLKVDK